MKYISVEAVASRLKDHFDVEMDLDKVIMHSGQVLKNMGLFALQREVVTAQVTNFQVNMPGRTVNVRGVVRLDGYIPDTYIDVQPIYFPPQLVWTSGDDLDVNALTNETIMSNYVPQIKGPYIDYVWENPFLRFNETDIPIAAIITSAKLSSKGYPMIPEDAFEACVYYCLYVWYQPLFLLGKIDGQRMGLITEWKNQKMRFAEQSHMLTELSANEADSYFDIITSHDRKRFGINM